MIKGHGSQTMPFYIDCAGRILYNDEGKGGKDWRNARINSLFGLVEQLILLV